MGLIHSENEKEEKKSEKYFSAILIYSAAARVVPLAVTSCGGCFSSLFGAF